MFCNFVAFELRKIQTSKKTWSKCEIVRDAEDLKIRSSFGFCH